MPRPRPDAPRELPPWLTGLASAAVAFHLGAVALLALAAPSGPWPTAFGTSTAAGPQFARGVSAVTTPYYLGPLKLTHNYHFAGNRPGATAVYVEARLKDAAGRPVATVRLPDETANFWVRHREALLAQWLTDDQPVQPRMGEAIPAPNRAVPTVSIWDGEGPGRPLALRAVPEHLVPRERPVFRPSDWSLLLARSYARHLCRRYGAASAELVRHTREPVLPAVLFLPEPPADAFDELISNFGELPR
jgi:hypothetical protein